MRLGDGVTITYRESGHEQIFSRDELLGLVSSLPLCIQVSYKMRNGPEPAVEQSIHRIEVLDINKNKVIIELWPDMVYRQQTLNEAWPSSESRSGENCDMSAASFSVSPLKGADDLKWLGCNTSACESCVLLSQNKGEKEYMIFVYY